jgi:hypothetical protein
MVLVGVHVGVKVSEGVQVGDGLMVTVGVTVGVIVGLAVGEGVAEGIRNGKALQAVRGERIIQRRREPNPILTRALAATIGARSLFSFRSCKRRIISHHSRLPQVWIVRREYDPDIVG